MSRWIFGMCIALWASAVFAEDWYRWRGPNADGISSERVNVDSLQRLWSKELGAGHSSVCVKEGRLYTMGNVDNQDVVYCLDALTGEEIWTFRYDCSGGSYPGPRATPVWDSGRLYTFSREGVLYCLDPESGKAVWKIDVLAETGNKNIRWGLSCSPVIEGDLILLNVGPAGVAVDKKSGKRVWDSGVGTGSYASAVVFTHKNRRCAAFFTAYGLQIVEASSGKRLADYPWKTKYDVNGADPLVIGDKIFISSGYDHGCALLQFDGSKLKNLWKNELLKNHFTSSIYLNGYIYGNDGHAGNKKGFLRCIRLETGEEVWQMPMGFGSVLLAQNTLIALNEQDRLYLVKATPEECSVLREMSIGIGKTCWTTPVLSHGILYCRNTDGTLVALDGR
jgi:outer membrane protein assembly factor BamB